MLIFKCPYICLFCQIRLLFHCCTSTLTHSLTHPAFQASQYSVYLVRRNGSGSGWASLPINLDILPVPTQSNFVDRVHRVKYGRHSKCNMCHENNLFVADGKKSWTTTDCYKHLNDGIRASGVYTLYVGENQHKMSAYCDMETNGGGWTVCVIKSRYDDDDDTIQYNTTFV